MPLESSQREVGPLRYAAAFSSALNPAAAVEKTGLRVRLCLRPRDTVKSRSRDIRVKVTHLTPPRMRSARTGLPVKPREISTPAPVIDLMAALKSSLVQEPAAAKGAINVLKQHPIGARGRCFCRYRAAEKRKRSGRPNQLRSPRSDARRREPPPLDRPHDVGWREMIRCSGEDTCGRPVRAAPP